MGVLGLWQLLNPTARTIKIEGLEGKVIAIDISIWLYQATKGSSARNAHISVLFNRICKLLYYKIKPIFVFDGPEVPALKRRVLQERQKRRQVATNKTKEIDLELQKNLLESIALSQILGVKPDQSDLDALKTARNLDSKNNNDGESDFDLFELKNVKKEEIEMLYKKKHDDESLDDSVEVLQYPSIDEIDQEVFDNLPIDIQMELLTSYKESLKRNKGKNFVDFPEKSEDFSSYQLKALLHKGEVARKLNNLKETINTSIANDMGIPFKNVIYQKIASEDDQEILFISKQKPDKFTTFRNMLESEYSQVTKSSSLESGSKMDMFELEKDFLMQRLHRNNSDTTTTTKEEDVILVENESSVEALNEETRPITPPLVEIESPIPIIINQVTNTQDERKSPMPTIEINVLKRSHEDRQIVNSDVKEPKVPKLDIDSSDVAEPKVLELDETESSDVAEPKVLELDETESSDDDDDFVEVVIPEAPVLQRLVSSTQNSVDKDDDEIILIEDPLNQPTTSSKAAAKFDILELIQNEDINLDDYNLYLENRKREILKEKQRENKLASSIENYMIDDAMRLLELFGLPYIVSPGEAEAQCAFLDLTNQTDGSITEDSDVWLFGANSVYKNFFNPNQYIEHYTASLIKSQLGLDRETLICVALLVGSDYTTGIEGVGVVKAIEILHEFDGEGFEKLVNFRSWHEKSSTTNEKLSKLRSSLKKLNLSKDFPSQLVHDAYMRPNVEKKNKSREEFSWSVPDLDSIRKFLTSRLSWNVKKIDDSLLPIIKRLTETKIQKTIDTYFTCETVSNLSKQSKRMKNAISLFKTKKVNNNKNEILNLSEEDEDDEDQHEHDNKTTTTTTSPLKLSPIQIKKSTRKQKKK